MKIDTQTVSSSPFIPSIPNPENIALNANGSYSTAIPQELERKGWKFSADLPHGR
jgi:hypothetical protein